MDLELSGKLALVSGSTGGIGFAIAKGLAAEGARVVVNGRTESRVAAAERFPNTEILVNNPGTYEGRIIFISSQSGVKFPVEMMHYGVTKTMQIALARGLAESTSGTAVTVNSILAGPTRPEGVEAFVQDFAKARNMSMEQFEKEFLVFIASPLSSATNGAALRVDGGVVRSIL